VILGLSLFNLDKPFSGNGKAAISKKISMAQQSICREGSAIMTLAQQNKNKMAV
jgi:hypothetical protein